MDGVDRPWFDDRANAWGQERRPNKLVDAPRIAPDREHRSRSLRAVIGER